MKLAEVQQVYMTVCGNCQSQRLWDISMQREADEYLRVHRITCLEKNPPKIKFYIEQVWKEAQE